MVQNKNVLITGANRGIGKALLREFAATGWDVLAHARKETVEFIQLIEKIKKEYAVQVIPVYFDFEYTENIKTVLKTVLQSKIQIHALINNAGIAHGGLFQMTPIEKIKQVFAVNFFAHMEITQIILRNMMRYKSGSIVNIASVSGMDMAVGGSAYGVSKAALIAWTKVLAAEVGRMGIRVNAVAPGITDTDMGNQNGQKTKDKMIESSAMKRTAQPDEIAKAAVFLVSEQSSFINGQILRVDGGKE